MGTASTQLQRQTEKVERDIQKQTAAAAAAAAEAAAKTAAAAAGDEPSAALAPSRGVLL